MARTITDEIPAGTVAESWAITDVKPDIHVYGSENLSPSDQADILADSPEPEETFEEYMERHAD